MGKIDGEKIKVALYIALAGIVLIVIYKLYKFISKGITGATDGLGLTMSELEKNDNKNRLTLIESEAKSQGLKCKLSFTKESYLKMAMQLYTAMKGIGTNNAVVIAVLNAQKNQCDWNELIKAFGIKEDENLISWLRSEYKYSDKLKTTQKIVTFANPSYALLRVTGLVDKVITATDLNNVLKKHGITANLI